MSKTASIGIECKEDITPSHVPVEVVAVFYITLFDSCY